MITAALIAIGLNFDTFSLAIVEGSRITKTTINNAVKVALFFGIGQAAMALLGAFLGLGFKQVISNIDHWIAFILLGLVGGKLILDSGNEVDCDKRTDAINLKSLSLLVIASSIDAAVVGMTFAFINDSIITDILMIGIITTVISFTGFLFGKTLRRLCKSKVKIVGGIILILVGTKILIEHLFI